jgi:hypothetical protein
MAPIDWVLVVSTGIGGLFGLFCLFDGARRTMLHGANSASSYLIALGAVIALALAGYAYWQAEFVDSVMWLVWGAAALVFGALFAREPEPVPEPDTITIVKIEPVLAPPVAAQAPPPAAPPPAAPPKPLVGLNTMPLAKPAVGGDTVPLPKPAVGEDTVPLPKPGIASVTIPLARPSVGDDTVPLPKPAPGTFTPPKKT